MKFRNVSLGILSAAALVGAMLVTSPAAASVGPGNIRSPFEPGGAVYVFQGYDNAKVTHTGTSRFGLDLTSSTSTTSTSGRVVVAPQSGKVAYWQAEYGNLCVNVANNRSYTLTHIKSDITTPGATITSGQKVGTVAPANTTRNNGVAHLHFQYWAAPNCYNSSTIPFSAANSLRICGAPDMTASGPNSAGNGTWSGTKFTASTCGTTKSFSAAPGPATSATHLGTRLTSSTGTWIPTPTSLTRQWYRSGAAVSGQTGSTYVLTSADRYKFVQLRVTGKLSGYTTTTKNSKSWFVAQVTSANNTQYLNIRSSPSTSATIVGRIDKGRFVALDCYRLGTSVKGPYGTSSIWYRITGVGWVSDSFLETNSNSAVTKLCP